MKKLFLPLYLLFALSTIAQVGANPSKTDGETPKKSKQSDLTIIDWNIEWFPGGKPYAKSQEIKDHIKIVKETIKKLNPDVLIAQEIRDWDAFNTICSSIDGLNPLAISAFPKEDTGEYWPQQLAIGSKLRTLAAWSQPFTPTENKDYSPRRGFTVAALKIPNSRYLILVYSIHLKSNRVEEGKSPEFNEKTRYESIKQVIQHVKETQSTLFKDKIAFTIVAGDFNTNDDGQWADNVIKTMEEAGFYNTWKNIPKEQRLTWVGNKMFPPNCLDFIFTKDIEQVEASLVSLKANTEDKNNIEASDHRPIKLIIDGESIEKRIKELDELAKLSKKDK